MYRVTITLSEKEATDLSEILHAVLGKAKEKINLLDRFNPDATKSMKTAQRAREIVQRLCNVVDENRTVAPHPTDA